MNSEEFCRFAWSEISTAINGRTEAEVYNTLQETPLLRLFHGVIVREVGWYQIDRPFYNVWPIAIDLIASVALDIRWSEIRFPYRQILFRFPVGHEPFGLSSALVVDHSGMLQDELRRGKLLSTVAKLPGVEARDVTYGAIEATLQFAARPTTNENLGWMNEVRPDGSDETVEETLTRLNAAGADPHVEFVYRLAVFTALLAKGEDLITPVILSKDQAKYEVADDDRRRWLEDRATRIQGRGFDLGKKLQEEKDASPHWRNPHLCLFWTGPGRGEPLLKLRRGGVVVPRKLSEIPTGFLGEETPRELEIASAVFARVSIPARLRFEILRRDDYRCQLCGRSAADGVRLHIDHKAAVSKGGANSVDNLWTLCEPCNLGKSDLSLEPE